MERAPITDPEALFASLAAGDVERALELLASAPAPDSEVGRHAAWMVAEAVAADTEVGPDTLERAVVLGRAGRLPVGRAVEAQMLHRLLDGLKDDPVRAAAIARFRPDLPVCAAIMAQHTAPARRPVSADEASVVAADAGHGAVDGGRSIFRSETERQFFQAARKVFAAHLVCPNVALHAALSFDALRARLTPAERRVFFSALVDCVVFDASASYRPLHFFELDSEVHDDHHRGERDEMKDRIVTLAGYRLVRLRPTKDARTADDFAAMLGRILAA